MGIVSIDGIIAGMRQGEEFLKVGGTMENAGIKHSLFYTSGRPGAAVAPSPGLAGAALTSYAGQMPFTNPVSGNSYLARLAAHSTQVGTLLLLDRLWHNSGINVTTTTGQTINSVAWPARDRDGSTNGESVLVALECSAATTAPATGITLTYTNQGGTGGKTATMASWPSSAAAGTFVPFQLAAGDTGIRSIQTLTLGVTLTAGTIHLVAYRVLGRMGISLPNAGVEADAIACGFPRLYDNTVPFLVWLASGSTGVTVGGEMVVSQG